MDPATHVLSGALLARATAPPRPRKHQLSTRTRVLVGALASGFPDADLILRFIDPLFYLAYHRSVLNSVVLLPLWTVLLSGLFWLLWRRQYPVRAFAGVCLLVLSLHIFMDLITSFGSMIFSPISFARLALSTTFIIDPYLSAIIATGVLASLFWRHTRLPAVTAFTVLTAYIGTQAILHQRALSAAEEYADAQRIENNAIYALPQPFSPFNWMLVVLQDDVYHVAYISLLRKEVAATPPDAGMLRKVYDSYRPAQHALWQSIPRFGQSLKDAELARVVWEHDTLRIYRHFALLPALYRIDNDAGTCVWFRDLRFALVGRGPVFPFGLCREHARSPWRLYRLTDEGKELLL
ncbi:MAG: metal-dependent hydrolase [Acidiferrobacterales bacterium]